MTTKTLDAALLFALFSRDVWLEGIDIYLYQTSNRKSLTVARADRVTFLIRKTS
jgi:hypothetical protein